MKPFTCPVFLPADAAIDHQLHTIYSDGTWTPAQLVDYLLSEQFGLAALPIMIVLMPLRNCDNLRRRSSFPF